MKFSVTDSCLKQNMEFRIREHELEMEIKRIDRDCKRLELELLKEDLEIKKLMKETAGAEQELVEIRKEKEKTVNNATLAAIKRRPIL